MIVVQEAAGFIAEVRLTHAQDFLSMLCPLLGLHLLPCVVELWVSVRC
jgi:hypothetical protein